MQKRFLSTTRRIGSLLESTFRIFRSNAQEIEGELRILSGGNQQKLVIKPDNFGETLQALHL